MKIILFSVICCVGSIFAETNYEFRVRLAQLHQNRLEKDAVPVGRDEVEVTTDWGLAYPEKDDVIAHAAADLGDCLAKSMGVKIGGGNGGSFRGLIRLSVNPELKRNQSKIETKVEDGTPRVEISGPTSRDVMQGCYRLEDMLCARGRPALKKGVRTFTRMFSPRMVHSGWGEDVFPDIHLDQIAHAGMDAILVYINEAPDQTRSAGRLDMPALVERARIHGLDVYAYVQYWHKPLMHPLDKGAEEFYERKFGSIVKNAPGLKGVICVGESCGFPSRDPDVKGYSWSRERGKKINGFYPVSDWKDWIELVQKVTRRYNPDFDVVFWTYNWYWSPEKERVALLERIPTDLTLHVTFVMGSPEIVRNGVRHKIQDYSITDPGPSETFVSEARVAGRRGLRLTSMTNTGGRTWDFGGLPFEPVPYAWMQRYAALRKAKSDFGLAGLMDSHHFGFTPNFVAEIAKAAFTEEFGEREIDETMRAIAARDFGRDKAEEVLAVWKDWSDAFDYHSAYAADQYGPLRVGASYPLIKKDEAFPAPPAGRSWRYLNSAYSFRVDELAPRIVTDEKEMALYRRGNERLEKLLPTVPAEKQAAARRMLGFGKYMYATIRTLRNCRAYALVNHGMRPESDRKDILADERANVLELLPYVEADSSLGFEPSMLYVTDPVMLKWKLRQLDEEGR